MIYVAIMSGMLERLETTYQSSYVFKSVNQDNRSGGLEMGKYYEMVDLPSHTDIHAIYPEAPHALASCTQQENRPLHLVNTGKTYCSTTKMQSVSTKAPENNVTFE